MEKMKFDRILLKMSGEIFAGDHKFGIDPKITNFLANQVKKSHDLNKQIGIVIGGGNIFRGISVADKGLDCKKARMEFQGAGVHCFQLSSLRRVVKVVTGTASLFGVQHFCWHQIRLETVPIILIYDAQS